MVFNYDGGTIKLKKLDYSMNLKALTLVMTLLLGLNFSLSARIVSTFTITESGRSDFLLVESSGNEVNVFSCSDESNCRDFGNFDLEDLESFVSKVKMGDKLNRGLKVSTGLGLAAAAFFTYRMFTGDNGNYEALFHMIFTVPASYGATTVAGVCTFIHTKIRSRESLRTTAVSVDQSLKSCDLDKLEVVNLDEMRRGMIELIKTLN